VYTKAGADGVTGAHLKLLRSLLRSPAAAALAAASLSDGAAAAAAAQAAAEKLLLAAVEARVVPEGAGAAELAAVLGGLDAESLAAAGPAVAAQAALARGPLGLEPGAAAAVTNGRVILDWSPKRDGGGGGAAGSAEVGLTAEDFGLMQLYAQDLQPGRLEDWSSFDGDVGAGVDVGIGGVELGRGRGWGLGLAPCLSLPRP
jgi:hypothetical protein